MQYRLSEEEICKIILKPQEKNDIGEMGTQYSRY